jgi:hypothetical protein
MMKTNTARIINGLRTAVVAGLLATTGGVAHAAVTGMPGQSAPGVENPVADSRTGDAPSTARPAPASPATNDAYAQREASSRDVGDFAGGGAGIYIGGSTAAVVLLLVLLIVIL